MHKPIIVAFAFALALALASPQALAQLGGGTGIIPPTGAPRNGPYLTSGSVAGLSNESDITAAGTTLTWAGTNTLNGSTVIGAAGTLTVSGTFSCTGCIAAGALASGAAGPSDAAYLTNGAVSGLSAEVDVSGGFTFWTGTSVALQSNNASAVTFAFSNPGAGVANVSMDGDLAIDGGNVTTAVTFDSTVVVTGSITANGGFTCTDCVALTTETSGNYVASVATSTGLSGGAAGSEGAALTLSCATASGATAGCITPNSAPAQTITAGGFQFTIDPTSNVSALIVLEPGGNDDSGGLLFNDSAGSTRADVAFYDSAYSTAALRSKLYMHNRLSNAGPNTIISSAADGAGEISVGLCTSATTTAQTNVVVANDCDGTRVDVLEIDGSGNLQMDGDLTLDGGNIENALSAAGINLSAASGANAAGEYGFVGGSNAASLNDTPGVQLGAWAYDIDGTPVYAHTWTAGGGYSNTATAMTSTAGAASAGQGWTYTAQAGQATSGVGASPGAGGGITFATGAGGAVEGSGDGFGANAGGFTFTGGTGGVVGASGTTGGNGGGFTFTGGAGSNGNGTASGGTGGGLSITLGNGGNTPGAGQNSGTGGSFTVTAGNGGTSAAPANNAANGGGLTFTAGDGGANSGGGNGGNGGNITLDAGAAGSGGSPTAGRIIFQANATEVASISSTGQVRSDATVTGSWTDFITTSGAALPEDSSTGAPASFRASLSGGYFGNITCSWGTTGTGGTTGVVVKIRNRTDSSDLCSCTLGACTTAAWTPMTCSCNTEFVTAKTYGIQVSSSTDCAGNPADIYCAIEMGLEASP